jgi:hypothetical protein
MVRTMSLVLRLSSLRLVPLSYGAVLAAVIAASSPASAVTGDCGQPYTDGPDPSVTDALYILNGAVGLNTCPVCPCDLNGSGTVSTIDALRDLQFVVGLVDVLECQSCSVTTTTIPECPAAGALDGLVFNEKYTCVESGVCVDENVADKIKFHHLGGGKYEIRDVPDTGFVYQGTLACSTFEWQATSPGEYIETGTWEFTANMTAFSGRSEYEAIDHSYSGTCNETGAKAPANPPNPPACP